MSVFFSDDRGAVLFACDKSRVGIWLARKTGYRAGMESRLRSGWENDISMGVRAAVPRFFSTGAVGCIAGLSLCLWGCASSDVPLEDDKTGGDHRIAAGSDLGSGRDLADDGSDLNVVPGDTVLRVHYPRNDARYSKLSIRGSGAGLSWTSGKAMTKVRDGLYQARLKGVSSTLEWKPLLDDATWSRGKNFVVEPGQTVDIYPHFVTSKGRYLRVTGVRSTVLGNTRAVWLYLPPSFDENPEARYPILCMHDGQNLFDPRYAFGGRTWQVSQTLDAGIDALDPSDSLPEVVVIGPENTDRRLYEYTPTKSSDPTYRDSGGGDQYLKFVVEELLPLMNGLTSPVVLSGRLVSDPAKTTLAGSSLGGLITAYAGVKKPDVFGRIGIFSPSTWWDGRYILSAVKASVGKPSRVYVDSGDGGGEGGDDWMNTAELAKTYRDIGFRDGANLQYVLEPMATHNEDAWARRLPAALRFLLAGL
jgi:predicted alpha/beta superfamily hydrolase